VQKAFHTLILALALWLLPVVGTCARDMASDPADTATVSLWKSCFGGWMSADQVRDDIELARAACAKAAALATTQSQAIAQLARILTASTLAEQLLRTSASELTAQEVEAHFAAHPDRFTTRPTAILRQVFVSAEDPDPGEMTRAEERARSARARLDAGESFRTVAAELSDANESRFIGGVVGTIHPDSVSTRIAELVFSMKPGETSGPLKMSKGFVIFRVDAISHAASLPREESLDMARRDLAQLRYLRNRKDLLSTLSAELKPLVTQPDRATSAPGSGTWVTLNTGTSVSIAVAREYLESVGLAPGEGSADMIAEEMQMFRDKVFLCEYAKQAGIADSNRLDDTARLVECKLASDKYWREVRNGLHPTEPQLKEFLAQHRGDFRDKMIFSAAMLQIPVQSSKGTVATRPDEWHRELSTSTAALKRILRQFKGKPFADLLTETRKVFPGVNVVERDGVESVNHIVDPLAEVLAPGTVTDPIETRGGLLVMQLKDRKVRPPTFEELRPVLTSRWLDAEIRRMQDAVRKH
jgi:hypothetical protein